MKYLFNILLVVVLMVPVLTQVDAQTLVWPDDAPVNLVNSETLTTWDEGTFLVGLAIDSEGILFISTQMPMEDYGAIWQVEPTGEASVFTEVSAGTVAFHPDGTLYATVQFGNFFTDPENFRVGLARFDSEGNQEDLLMFSQNSAPNGITFDESGNLYVADSALGIIWIVTPDSNEAQIWLEDEAFTPQGAQSIPGLNGIQVFDGALYTVNSSSGDFFRIAINDDGTASDIEVTATGVTGDGFRIDDNGTAYITTHPFNIVVKVSADGTKEIIGNADNGIVGATDATLFTDETGKVFLYVVQDGGLFTQLLPPEFLAMFPQTTQEDFLPPSLVRLELDQ